MANGFKLGESLAPPSLSPNKVLITNNAGKTETSAITTSELNALSGIQGNIQQQINNIGGVTIDDTAASTSTVYSSSKTVNLINTSLAQLLDRLYPVGCVVMSFEDMTNTQLINRYGGTTWERIQDRYLVAAGSNHTVGTTGGSSTVTLVVDNLPNHSHYYGRSNTVTGSHTLTINEMPPHNHDQHVSAAVGGSGVRTDYTGDASSTAFPQGIGTGSTGGGGSHTHSITRTQVETAATGRGTAFSIEPPYIAVYMWRRIA